MISGIISSDAVQVGLRLLTVLTNTFVFLLFCNLIWFGCSFSLGPQSDPVFNVHLNGFTNVFQRLKANSSKSQRAQKVLDQVNVQCQIIDYEFEKERLRNTLTRQKITNYWARLQKIRASSSDQLDEIYKN